MNTGTTWSVRIKDTIVQQLTENQRSALPEGHRDRHFSKGCQEVKGPEGLEKWLNTEVSTTTP